MPDLKAELDACFDALKKEYDIERIDYIPDGDCQRKVTIPVWRLVLQAMVAGRVEDVEVIMAFPPAFPYEMPWVFVTDNRYRLLPHISYKSRKLCIYEDGIVYDATKIKGIIRDNIKRTRQWIERYVNRDNADEYAAEIKSYWSERYEDEPELDDHWILVGDMPTQSMELNVVGYSKRDYEDNGEFLECAVYADEDNPVAAFVKSNRKTASSRVLFLSSLAIPSKPPYSLTPEYLVDCITTEEDKKLFRQFVNHNHKGYILFPIGVKHMLGGVYIPKLEVKKKGFRNGSLSPYQVLMGFGNNDNNIERLVATQYEANRIAQRTAGTMMDERTFLVAGLGSIGSNLCYFLNGYNNARFMLADRDYLTTDNIGRHLLGFDSLGQKKTLAVEHYLKCYRPDREVASTHHFIQEMDVAEINKASALFVCTGDVMSEQWLLSQMASGAIRVPAFILWLEPYGISGVMLYVNPTDGNGIARLQAEAHDGFLNFCLISREEYQNGDKLTQRDAGCNGQYALYSANDVTLMLSALFPTIDNILSNPTNTTCFRWVGNVEIANQKGIRLLGGADALLKNTLQLLTL